jgi:hypothetical protein
MTRKLLQDIERVEAQTFAAGQLARTLVKKHRIPAERFAIITPHPGDSDHTRVDIMATDPESLRRWADALGATVTARFPIADTHPNYLQLSADVEVGSVPVHVWVCLTDETEATRYRAEGGDGA